MVMLCFLALAALGSGCQESKTPPRPSQGEAKDKGDGTKGGNTDTKEVAKTKEEMARLQGTWTSIAFEAAGMSFETKDDPKRSEAKITITDNSYQRGDQGSFKIDPAKNPKQIDFMPTDGQFRGKTLLGIYSLDNDILKICESAPSKGTRPTEFKTAPGSGTVLFTYKRAKL